MRHVQNKLCNLFSQSRACIKKATALYAKTKNCSINSTKICDHF